MRSQEVRNNVIHAKSEGAGVEDGHHDAWVRYVNLDIADDDFEDSSIEDGGNQGNGEYDCPSAVEEEAQHDANSPS